MKIKNIRPPECPDDRPMTADDLLELYNNLEALYDNLDEQGQDLFHKWIDTGDISLVLDYFPNPVAQYFRRAVAS